MIPYRFIVIEGNIGAGKTTLSKSLSAKINGKLILEQFSDNPFLPHFYKNPERYAFPVELFFMTERHKQLQENLLQPELFNNHFIADYFFLKTLIFAKNNLSEEEFRLFNRLFKVLNSTFPKPDIIIYLHRPIEALLDNITARGRSYEQKITSEYLKEVQNAYFEYFKSEFNIPILILNLGEKNISEDSQDYDKFLKLLEGKYKNGIQHVNL